MAEVHKHPYRADLSVPADWLGRRPCKCGLQGSNEVHNLEMRLPERTEDERALEDRRYGERDE